MDSPIIALAEHTLLSYEPLYLLMQQQLLADQMERARELGADVVSRLNIAPKANAGICRVPSRALKNRGATVKAVWPTRLRNPERFLNWSTEALFSAFPIDRHPALRPWWDYLHARHPWVGSA